MFRFYVLLALIGAACGQKTSQQHKQNPNETSNTSLSSPSNTNTNSNDFAKFVGKYEFAMDGGETAGGTPVFVGYLFDLKSIDNILISGDGYQTGFEVACKAEFVPNNPNAIDLVLSQITRPSSKDFLQNKLDQKQRIVFATINKTANQLTFQSEEIYDNSGACKTCVLAPSK